MRRGKAPYPRTMSCATVCRDRLVGGGDCNQNRRHLLELYLTVTRIVIELIGQHAAGYGGVTRGLLIHACVDMCLRCSFAGAILLDLERHRAGLKRKVQPHGNEQPQRFTAPLLSSFTAPDHPIQSNVPTKVICRIHQSSL